MLYITKTINEHSTDFLENHYGSNELVRLIKNFQKLNELHINTTIEIIRTSNGWVDFNCDRAASFLRCLAIDANETLLSPKADLVNLEKNTSNIMLEVNLIDIGYSMEEVSNPKAWAIVTRVENTFEFYFSCLDDSENVGLNIDVWGNTIIRPDSLNPTRRIDVSELHTVFGENICRAIVTRSQKK